MKKLVISIFLLILVMACKKPADKQPENNATQEQPATTTQFQPGKDKILSSYIKEYGNEECAKKEIDTAMKECKSDAKVEFCAHELMNQNCNLGP
ncbi:MAG: hypothetical protein AAF518_04450 [Spirochaetota bacterium]